MHDTDLNRSKIINVNDFIFKQNLEFYPNLRGISCEDNVITWVKDGTVVASTPLTFDLRVLPGDAWLVTPAEFISIIKLNKECKGLYNFIDLIQTHCFDTFPRPELSKDNTNNDLEAQIKKYMHLYFTAKESNKLTEDNVTILSQVGNNIAVLPEESYLKSLINSEIDKYFAATKELGKNIETADELKQGPVRALVKKEETPKSSRAAFINVAVLLYGILNIGIILAIALMK